MVVPSTEALNRLPADAFSSALAPLFEGGEGLLRRLADARPFASDADLLVAAREVARSLPPADQVDLLDAHPRIGGDPSSISTVSFREQGYDLAASQEDERIHDELAALNDAYERRFGFRYVIFVALRPRSAIPPLIDIALRNERAAELARGIDDVIDIAADRLGRIRAADPNQTQET